MQDRRVAGIFSLMVEFMGCRSLPDGKKEGWPALLKLLRKQKGTILRYPRGKPHPNPERARETWGLGYEQSKLAPDSYDFLDSRTVGRAMLGYYHDFNTVQFSQATFRRTPVEKDAIAEGLLDLGMFFYTALRPQYGWVDMPKDKYLPGGKDISEFRVRSFFWANWFGPAFVEKIGRSFLMKVPAYRVQELEDGGIVVVATPTYCEWWLEAKNEAVEYLRSKLPRLKQAGRTKR
jgi:hypothetical protein